LTSSDVMPAMRQPVWNDDYGQLDGSFFYNLTANIQLGLQVNNITNSTTKLLMGPRGYRRDGFVDETLYNRAWFENDRRYSAVLRASWEGAHGVHRAEFPRGGSYAACGRSPPRGGGSGVGLTCRCMA